MYGMRRVRKSRRLRTRRTQRVRQVRRGRGILGSLLRIGSVLPGPVGSVARLGRFVTGNGRRRRRVGRGLLSGLASSLGLGRRKRVGRPRRGRGLLSSGLAAFGLGRRPRVRRTRRRRVGRGVASHSLSKLGLLKGFLTNAHNFIRSNKSISKGLTHLGADRLAGIASSYGYGRKRRRTYRRRTRRLRGGSVGSHSLSKLGLLKGFLRNAHNFVRSNKSISKGLTHLGADRLAGIASSYGYGRKRRRTRRTRRLRGGSYLPYDPANPMQQVIRPVF